MNNTFSLKNFRVFDDKGAEFEIAPITVLTGCNSSGKSSTIKAFMLLKEFFSLLKDDFANGRKFNMSDYELQFNKGKHKLGSFQKTLSDYSKSEKKLPIMTFSWTKYSPLLWKDVRTVVNYVENKQNIFQNAVIKDIKIFIEDYEIVALDFQNGFNFRINYNILKKHFFHFAECVKHYDSVEDNLGINESTGFPNKFQNMDELSQVEGINIKAIESVTYAQKNLFSEKSIVTKCREIPKQALKFGVLLYLPILDWLNNVPKDNAKNVILEKIKESEDIGDVFIKAAIRVINDFEKSEFKSFIEFYIEKFDKQLTKCFCLNQKEEYLKSSEKLDDKSFLLENIDWQSKYETPNNDEVFNKAVQDMMVNDVPRDNFFEEIYDYISIDDSKYQRYEFDFNFWRQYMSGNLSDSPKLSSNYIDFMFLAGFCINIDKNFSGNRLNRIDFKPIANPVEYYIAKEHNAATSFVLDVIKDSIFNMPSFIDNIDFIEAIHANIQRIYSFNEKDEFTEIINSYIKKTEKDKEIEKNNKFKTFRFRIREDGTRELISYKEYSKPEEFKSLEKDSKPETKEKSIQNDYMSGDFIRKWIRKFDIADDIILENTAEGLGVLIYLIKGEKKELLADKGYGITQFLAILLKIETIIVKSRKNYFLPLVAETTVKPKEKTISIEEPETNLHPKFQSLLAEMFIDAYKSFNIHFIIETHSEYIIRKLQSNVAKKVINKDDIAIHYIYHPDPKKRPAGTPQVSHIKIKESGALDSPFGSGFFDEADNLALELLTGNSQN